MRALLVAGALLWPIAANATLITLNVTPTSTLRAAVAKANADTNLLNSYDIRLAPGTYLNDFAPTITRPMAISGAGATTTTLQATAPLPNSKGILLTVSSLLVRGLTFTGAAISNALGGNGAGIRDQIGTGGSDPNGTLIVQDSVFRGNQEGILTGGSGGREHVIVMNSAFRNNGNASKNTGQEHGIYVNDAASLLILGSTFCGQQGQGHNIKGRAAATTIAEVRSYEGVAGGGCANAGNASRGIDLPNGGIAFLSDVDLFQGSASPNYGMMSFGVEGVRYASNRLTMREVDFNSTRGGVAIQWGAGTAPCLYDPATTFTGLAVSSPAGVCKDPPIGASSEPISVTEPGSLTLLGGALLGLLLWRRRV